ncbi:hypothetical protein FS935_01845 [Metabacillus litoralis]|uniref:Uncharacterized protein n=1 Tax=Metabacillus litoralis TaxID=152268 RepID=A0A5C6W937_9BACI|nr:hypothetical protein [Metabacillus litoralis]TXC92960.1 hypothetical protein FS935_01845 [Metabacillus litoralis]
MLPTLLLPIVEPYGDPYTIVNPTAHHMRKEEFFQWVRATQIKYQMTRNMPLRITADFVTEGNSIIEGFQEATTNFVPSNLATQSVQD